MSAIPPTFLGSLIQTHGAQQRESARKREAESADADRPAFSRELTGAIENDDRDSQAYSDAEGSGGYARQRPDEAPPDQDQTGAAPETPSGGIDLQA